eukprot:GCRY01000056.1.p2 GENE.GCRY01000056.1~~GCRY01000056.1.p2  ORF type:complete len:120 (-),score=22.53 GCRY01000056.1:86-418(-)
MVQPVRLYNKGVILGYRRSRTNQHPNCALIKIEGVEEKKDTSYYLGKRVAYIYKATKAIKGKKYRVMWGKITRCHGNNGVVRASFKNNVPPKAFGASCRVMMYPVNNSEQ